MPNNQTVDVDTNDIVNKLEAINENVNKRLTEIESRTEDVGGKLWRWYKEGWVILGKSIFAYVATFIPLALIATLI